MLGLGPIFFAPILENEQLTCSEYDFISDQKADGKKEKELDEIEENLGE